MPAHKKKGKRTPKPSHRYPLAKPGTHPRTNFDNHPVYGHIFAPKPKPVKHLLDLPNTPIGICRFQYGMLESFDQAVRDLIQSDPDHPIGGYPTSPASKPMIYSTKSTDIELVNMASLAAISASKNPPKKPLESRSNISRVLLSRSANARASLMSELSLPMVTAPQTPTRCQQSDDSYAAIGIRDFGDCENSVIGECSDSPCMGNGFDGMACCSIEAESQGLEDCPASLEDRCPGPDLCPERPKHRNDLSEPPTAPAESDLLSPPAHEPQLLRTASAPIYFPSGDGPPVEMPIDATGLQPAPPTPAPTKRSKGKQKFLQGIRKTRVAVLRKPVLSVVVGRRLSGVTRTALKAIVNREVPDYDAIEAAVLPVANLPAPVPIST